MKRSLAALLQGIVRAPELDVTGLQTDSRRVTAGDVFLAVKGVGGHGLQHVEMALDRGASAVLWEPAPGIAEPDDLPVPQIAVTGLGQRVGELASRFMGEPARDLFNVAVTGTDGKTSTAYLVAQALDAAGSACGYLGTIGYGRVGALKEASHTTPDPIRLQALIAALKSDGVRAMAMEVSSHALDQARVSGLAFDVSILTNITRDHLDYHGTVEAYAAAKKKLFTRYTRGAAVLNRDDVAGAAWAAELGDAVVYGIGGEAPQGRYLLARDVSLGADGIAFTLDSSWGQAAVRSRLLGRFNVYNLLAALAALLLKGLPLSEVARIAETLHTVPGRIEGFRGGKPGPLVVVDYAHTPEALAQILTAVRAHCGGRLWCVFGCGGDRDRGKRPLMGRAAAMLADAVIVTDDNPRSEAPEAIAAEIVAAMPAGTRIIHDRAEAIRTALAEAAPDDVVVIAGKGHETTQTYGSTVRPFSDRQRVRELLA